MWTRWAGAMVVLMGHRIDPKRWENGTMDLLEQ